MLPDTLWLGETLHFVSMCTHHFVSYCVIMYFSTSASFSVENLKAVQTPYYLTQHDPQIHVLCTRGVFHFSLISAGKSGMSLGGAQQVFGGGCQLFDIANLMSHYYILIQINLDTNSCTLCAAVKK